MGDLEFTGNGSVREPPAHISVAGLDAARAETNSKLLERLKADAHAGKLMQACQDDFALHRMTEPKPLEFSELASGSFSPRFSVEQGVVLSTLRNFTGCPCVLCRSQA